MQFCPRLILVPIVLVAVGGTAAAQPRIDADLLRSIAQAGSAGVIVGVRARFEPEGRLSAPQIESQQAGIRDAVDRVLASLGGAIEVRYRYRTIPFFSARIDSNGLAALTRMPDVLTIEADIPEPPALADSVPIINVPAAHSAGATGAGWKVAVLDTGVQTDHPFLTGKTVAEGCFSNGSGGGTSVCPGGANSTSPGSGAACALGGCDHGTHVAGIAVGSGATFTGVARGAQLIAIQVFTNISGSPSSYPSDQVLGMERVLALAGPGNVNQVAAVNLSLGGSRYFDQATCDAASPSRKAIIDNLRAVGIATVIASGNNSYTDSMQIPGCISSAVSVGSTTKSDVVSSFSNRAPFLSLMAPGSSINSAVLGSAFGFKSGTSMAAPHAAGAWAVLKQSKPGASVSEVLDALRSTGAPITDPASDVESPQATYPRINVGAARTRLTGPIAPGSPTVSSAVENGGILSVTWAPAAGGSPSSHRLDFFAAGTFVLSVNAGAGTSVDIPIPPGTAGAFSVQVIAINGVGSSAPSALFPFTIGIGAPGAPTITTVSVTGNAVNIAWTRGPGPTATTHRLDFYAGEVLVAQVTVGAATNASIPIPPDVVGTFGVRVTPFNGAIAGPTSAQANFTVGPVCSVLPAPIVSGGVAGGTATASWLPVSGAASYVVSAGTTPEGMQYVPPTNVRSATTVSASGVPSGFFAWVRVIAINACGHAGPATDFLVQ